MSEKNYDFLEDIFTTLSNKWNAKDREVRINDSVRRDVDYLTYLITVLDGHNETRNMELAYTPFVAGYHYIIDNIKIFNRYLTNISILI